MTVKRTPLRNADSLTCVFSWPSVTFGAGSGGRGGAVGVTGFEGSEVAPTPTALTATTVNVTGRPAVRPVTVTAVRASDVLTRWPLDAMTVYLWICRPPFDAAAQT